MSDPGISKIKMKAAGSCSEEKSCALCEIEAETLLLLLSGFVLYMACCQLINWIVLYCLYILLPYVVLTFLYMLASVLLFFGVVCSVRGLIIAFVWVMILSLLADVAYVVMIYLDQRCLCNKLHWLTSERSEFYLTIMSSYSYLCGLAGVNFIVSFVAVLAVKDYLKAKSCSN